MRISRIASSLAAGALALSLIAPSSSPAVAAAPGAVVTGVENVVNDSNQQQVIDVFDGINAFRATKGLKALKFSVPLSSVSQDWSNTMAATDSFYHNPDYVSGAPQGWQAASEIIAARWDRNGQGLVTQWINSPGHNAVMSTDYYDTVGIGIAFTDMSKPEDPDTYRFGMYGTANLFTYGAIPAQTYNHPSDYFSGAPPLSTVKTVNPSAPAFWQYHYTLPDVEGVEYLVNGHESLPGTVQAGTFQVDITLVPKAGYAFPQGTVTSYSHRYEQLRVHPVAPEFRLDSASYVIPSVEGVQYTVDGASVAPGTHFVPPGTNGDVLFVATPLAGYIFDAEADTRWAAAYHVPLALTDAAPAPPTFDSSARTYSIPATAGVDYWVNGSKTAPGIYPGVGSVVIDATAQEGYSILGLSSWEFSFPASPTPVPDPGTDTPAFTDVPLGSQFSREISWMASNGISTGWTETDGSKTFRPLSPVNRDAMAAFMYRLAGKPNFTPPAVSPFADLPVGAQFYKEITWLAGQGISTGWAEADGTKTYRPLQPVNRDAMAAFMYRLDQKPAFTPPASSPFTDVPASGQFFKEITWLAAQGISTGWAEANDTRTYRPLQPVNRDAMAAFMYRYNSKINAK